MGFKRKNYFINKELQGKYIFKYFLLVALGSALFSLIFSFLSSNSLSIVYDNYHLELGTTPGILLNRILSTQWFFVVIAGLVTVVITLFLTHRIAGPFYRFEKTLDAMGEKDLSLTIVLREKDEGKVLAQKINDFNQMVSKQLKELRDGSESIDQICRQTGDTPLSGTALSDIEKINQRAMKVLNDFRLL